MGRPKVNRVVEPKADILFQLATTTDRKWLLNNAVARIKRVDYLRQHGISGLFAPLRLYAVHHSAVEDAKSRDLNVVQKHDDSSDEFNSLRPGGKLHDWFAERLFLEGMLRSLKDFDQRRFIHVSDDTTVGIPRDIWNACKDELAEHVPAHLLEADLHIFGGQPYVSVQEIGPLTGAMGTQRFWSIVRDGARRTGHHREIVLTNQITCLATRMSDPQGSPAHKAEAECPFILYDPADFGNQQTDPILTSDDFSSAPDARETPFAKRFPSYLVSPFSPHLAIVDQLMGIAAAGFAHHSHNVIDFRRYAQQQNKPKKLAHKKRNRHLILVQPSVGAIKIDGNDAQKIRGTTIRRLGIETEKATDIERYVTACSMEFDLGEKEKGHVIYQHADAILFPPFDPRDFTQRLDAILKFKSAVVAKQLDPRYLNVPIIVMNLGGCWDSILRDNDLNSSFGFNKNFPLAPYSQDSVVAVDGVHHRPTFYYHELRSDDERSMMRAVKKLNELSLSGYVRLEMPRQFDSMITHGGIVAPEGLTMIVPIGSASSENRHLNHDAYHYMSFAAEHGMGMGWGGGDQKTMGALRKGYHDANGAWQFAVNTHDITKVECITGRLPHDCSAWQLSRTITPRMMTMFIGVPDLSGQHKSYFNGGDFVTSFDGGPGTDQESAMFIALQRIVPDLMKGRSLIHYVPPYSTRGTFLKALYGDKGYERLLGNHDAFAEQGRFLATSLEELKSKTLEIGRHVVRPHQDSQHKRELVRAVAG
jgi:predicted Rossmann-fold nucleotide-binding protein